MGCSEYEWRCVLLLYLSMMNGDPLDTINRLVGATQKIGGRAASCSLLGLNFNNDITFKPDQ